MEEIMKRRLPDDSVSYCLYSKNLLNQHEKLNGFLLKCLAFFAKETAEYIWQNEGINLNIVQGEQCIPHLKGLTRFGDNIEDEWFIVFLIHKLTETYTDIVAAITDNDGEFLLIEAADFLPKWLTPHTCQNRVFISHGKLHLILKPQSPADCGILPVTTPSLEQSLNIVFNYPYISQGPSAVINSIGKRINKYPEKARESIFYANVYLPKKIIFLLDNDRNFISTSVNKFYLRDPIDLRACRTFQFFPAENQCWTQVAMTRCQYAQLTQQHFVPDKRSGYKIDNTVCPADVDGLNLGLKIAHGFEIICKNAAKSCLKNGDSLKPVNKELFKNLISNLKDNGYFKGEIEGSRLYNKLYTDAEKYFVISCSPNESDSQSQRILKVAKNYTSNKNLSFQTMKLLNCRAELPKESSKNWMKLTESDVDTLVQEMNFGFEKMKNKKKKNNFKTSSHEFEEKNLHEFSKKMNNFVEQQSSHEGVELDSETSFHPDQFVKSLEDILGFTNSNKSEFDNDFNSSDDDFLTSEEDEEVESSEHEEEIKQYFQSMDKELSKTSVEKTKDDDVEIDINLVDNFLQGVQHETGLSGPISNLINSLGVNIPKNVKLSE